MWAAACWEQRCIVAKSPHCWHRAFTKADVWCKAALWVADRATRPAAEGVFSSGFVSGFPSQSCPAETGSGGWRNLLYFSAAGTLPPSLSAFLLSLPSSSYFFFSVTYLSYLGVKGSSSLPQDQNWYVHGHTSNTFIEVKGIWRPSLTQIQHSWQATLWC